MVWGLAGQLVILQILAHGYQGPSSVNLEVQETCMFKLPWSHPLEGVHLVIEVVSCMINENLQLNASVDQKNTYV